MLKFQVNPHKWVAYCLFLLLPLIFCSPELVCSHSTLTAAIPVALTSSLFMVVFNRWLTVHKIKIKDSGERESALYFAIHYLSFLLSFFPHLNVSHNHDCVTVLSMVYLGICSSVWNKRNSKFIIKPDLFTCYTQLCNKRPIFTLQLVKHGMFFFPYISLHKRLMFAQLSWRCSAVLPC